MKIAVTGAQGQLGGQLVALLGDEAIPLDLPKFDLTDRKAVVRRIVELRPEAVINTAAYTAVDRAEEEPELARAVNAEGVAALVDACREIDATLVQISTDYVFGGDTARTEPCREADPPAPLNVYGRTKLDAERCVAAWPKHTIVRACGLYGPASPRAAGNFVATMLRLADTRDRINVVDDQHCTPSYTPHVARAVAFLTREQHWGTYHVVNRGATTWYRFARELFRLTGHTVDLRPITTDEYPTAAQRPRYSVLDTERYRFLPGAPAMPTWEEALAEHVTRDVKNSAAL